ncbi:MAG: hypothetical protein ACK5CW_15100 [Verrucomicrobiota bacterium]|jgi:hypothetical protein
MKQKSYRIRAAAVAAAAVAGSAQAAFVEVLSDITQDTRWTKDNVYILRDVVYVLPPAILTIEPGTIVRGIEDTYCEGGAIGDQPGSLFICRGAKIVANGTPDEPIIFTAIDDPYVPGGVATIPQSLTAVGSGAAWSYAANGFKYPKTKTAADSPNVGGAVDNIFAISGRWGGLVVLGRTPIGYDGDNDALLLQYNPVTGLQSGDAPIEPNGATSIPSSNDVKGGNGVGFALIEGGSFDTVTLGAAFNNGLSSSTSFRTAVYGGVNVGAASGSGANIDDNSGVMRFCSHRYGGFKLGTDNEVNGVTLGAVGRGTVVEWQDVFNNKDDGFEWFGGYVNCRYLFTAFQGDDGFDGDQGYQGRLQYLFTISDNSGGANAQHPSGTVTGRLVADASDRLFEWDGSEDNNKGVTPNTLPLIYNFTAIGNRGAGASPTAGSSDQGVLARRSTGGEWRNGLFEDINSNILGGDSTVGSSGVVAASNYYFNTGATLTASLGGNTFAAAALNASALRKKGTDFHRDQAGLDPRMTAATPLRTAATDAPAADGFFTPLRRAGAMADSNMLIGWTGIDSVGLVDAVTVPRPEPILGVSGGNATVSFAAATVDGNAVVYAVERSSDLRVWTPLGVVSDGAAGDANAAAGQITWQDTASVANGVLHYRVIPQ